MAKDFLYKTAPLIEVIAEVHWELQPLLAIPNAAIDPHFPVLLREFRELAKAGGFSWIEQLVPDQIPTEMFPHSPRVRYRREPEKWPLFQLGPGILAINIVPPYEGWNAYRQYINQAIDWLFTSYPLPDKYLKISKLELRYLDGFTRALGYSNYLDFVRKELTFNFTVPAHIAALFKAPQEALFAVEMQLPVASPSESLAVFKLSPGQVKNEDALIMEMTCRTARPAGSQKPSAILQWMDTAHSLLREAFAQITSESLKTRMGPKIELEGEASEISC